MSNENSQNLYIFTYILYGLGNFGNFILKKYSVPKYLLITNLPLFLSFKINTK